MLMVLGCRSAVWCSLICGLPHIGKRSETLEICVDVILMFALWPSPGALLQFSVCVVFAACSGEGLVCSKKSVVGLEARFSDLLFN